MAPADETPPPPRAPTTTKEEFMRIQQQRIDALKYDTVQVTRTPGATAAASKAAAAAAASPPPPAATAPPPPPPPPHKPGKPTAPPPRPPAAVSITMPAGPVRKRERLPPLEPWCPCQCVCITFAVTLTFFAVFAVIAGAFVIPYPSDWDDRNTEALAVVISISDTVAAGQTSPLCPANFTFLSHDGVSRTAGGLLDADMGLCQQARVGGSVTVCYSWRAPANVAVGECDPWVYSDEELHHYKKVAVVLFIVGAVPLACLLLGVALWVALSCCRMCMYKTEVGQTGGLRTGLPLSS